MNLITIGDLHGSPAWKEIKPGDWAHSRETYEDPLKGYHQVVGNSRTYDGIVTANHYGNDTSVTYTDYLETVTEFYRLEII